MLNLPSRPDLGWEWIRERGGSKSTFTWTLSTWAGSNSSRSMIRDVASRAKWALPQQGYFLISMPDDMRKHWVPRVWSTRSLS